MQLVAAGGDDVVPARAPVVLRRVGSELDLLFRGEVQRDRSAHAAVQAHQLGGGGSTGGIELHMIDTGPHQPPGRIASIPLDATASRFPSRVDTGPPALIHPPRPRRAQPGTHSSTD